MIRSGNLALKFGLELVAIAAFAYWGTTVGTGFIAVLLAIAAPLVAIFLWGRFAAPMSDTRLPLRARIPFELAVLGLAALALLSASAVGAAVFAAVVLANTVLLTTLDQWER